MQENNRHILSAGIMDLPEHKAPTGLWDIIETMMFGVPVDMLPVHRPPASTWTTIEAGIGRSAHYQKSLYRNLAIALLVFLLGGTAILYFNAPAPPPPEKSNFGIATTNGENDGKQEDIINDAEKNAQIALKHSNTVPPETKEPNNHPPKKQVEKESIVTDRIVETMPQFPKGIDLTFLEPTDIGSVADQWEKTASNLCLNNPSPVQDINAIKHDPFQDCDFNPVEHSYYISPGFEYQHFLNSFEPENAKMKHWFSTDLRVIFKRNRFIVETGLGIAFSTDKLDFTYDYLTNELINTYEYVDSVYYDPVTGTTHYFTTTVEVYDSIPYSKHSSSETSYTYLQIPFEVGYEVWKARKFSIFIKAGATFFTELDKKNVLPNLSHENSRITSISTNNVSRNKELFKVSGGLGFRWNFNKKVNFTFNPTFSYFPNRIYDNGDVGEKPTALGIRFGLYYKF